VPIYSMLRSGAFRPDEVELLASAFEAALKELDLRDRSDPASELVAKRIMEFARKGERDPNRLREAGVKGF
jgi:hypothetical protein